MARPSFSLAMLYEALRSVRGASSDVRRAWAYDTAERYILACVRHDAESGAISDPLVYFLACVTRFNEQLPYDMRPHSRHTLYVIAEKCVKAERERLASRAVIGGNTNAKR